MKNIAKINYKIVFYQYSNWFDSLPEDDRYNYQHKWLNEINFNYEPEGVYGFLKYLNIDQLVRASQLLHEIFHT